jgi:hypothetical protein
MKSVIFHSVITHNSQFPSRTAVCVPPMSTGRLASLPLTNLFPACRQAGRQNATAVEKDEQLSNPCGTTLEQLALLRAEIALVMPVGKCR